MADYTKKPAVDPNTNTGKAFASIRGAFNPKPKDDKETDDDKPNLLGAMKRKLFGG